LTIGDDGGTNSASPPPAPTTFTALAAGDLTINGYDIGAVAAGIDALTQGNNVAAAINALTSKTGVTATTDRRHHRPDHLVDRRRTSHQHQRHLTVEAATGTADSEINFALRHEAVPNAATPTAASS
jgi:hypothetical protein